MKRVDLNADIGEGMAYDEALMPVLTSANIACAMHAGSPDEMAKMVALARKHNVQIGAHPGFDDRENFGRRNLELAPEALRHLIQYQIGALQAIAKAQGARVAHVKLHGAMANMAAADEAMAMVCYQAVRDLDPELEIYTIAQTSQMRAAKALGCRYKCEIFADRAYNDDGSLVNRALEGAVLDDAGEIIARLDTMIEAGAIIAQSGARLPTPIDTICVHSDTKSALEIAKAIRAAMS